MRGGGTGDAPNGDRGQEESSGGGTNGRENPGEPLPPGPPPLMARTPPPFPVTRLSRDVRTGVIDDQDGCIGLGGDLSGQAIERLAVPHHLCHVYSQRRNVALRAGGKPPNGRVPTRCRRPRRNHGGHECGRETHVTKGLKSLKSDFFSGRLFHSQPLSALRDKQHVITRRLDFWARVPARPVFLQVFILSPGVRGAGP